ncbi:MAG TPA: hypothetical protein VGU03_10975 [Frateuria sp.]|uniref:hypothetical protein n=1 Tax=Frateuria sp. TaxID=2211372 RepID=UPI002DE3A782|nr:hypothetical protein [Frateuria sp.]
MTPIHCATCQHFRPDASNPPAAMGECAKGLGWNFPMAPHWCKKHEAVPEPAHG